MFLPSLLDFEIITLVLFVSYCVINVIAVYWRSQSKIKYGKGIMADPIKVFLITFCPPPCWDAFNLMLLLFLNLSASGYQLFFFMLIAVIVLKAGVLFVY